jgi:hypothetical protein
VCLKLTWLYWDGTPGDVCVFGAQGAQAAIDTAAAEWTAGGVGKKEMKKKLKVLQDMMEAASGYVEARAAETAKAKAKLMEDTQVLSSVCVWMVVCVGVGVSVSASVSVSQCVSVCLCLCLCVFYTHTHTHTHTHTQTLSHTHD